MSKIDDFITSMKEEMLKVTCSTDDICELEVKQGSDLPPLEVMEINEPKKDLMVSFMVDDWGDNVSNESAAGSYSKIFVKEFPKTWERFKGRIIFSMFDT